MSSVLWWDGLVQDEVKNKGNKMLELQKKVK